VQIGTRRVPRFMTRFATRCPLPLHRPRMDLDRGVRWRYPAGPLAFGSPRANMSFSHFEPGMGMASRDRCAPHLDKFDSAVPDGSDDRAGVGCDGYGDDRAQPGGTHRRRRAARHRHFRPHRHPHVRHARQQELRVPAGVRTRHRAAAQRFLVLTFPGNPSCSDVRCFDGCTVAGDSPESGSGEHRRRAARRAASTRTACHRRS